jgi:hypothetical protein
MDNIEFTLEAIERKEPRVSEIADTCSVCGAAVKVQINKSTGVCSEICRKRRDGN